MAGALGGVPRRFERGDDAQAGHDTAMYAWRRRNVAALNSRARAWMAAAGRLTGPELEAPGGRRYAAGDHIVTLAPGANGHTVTSERGQVVNIDEHTTALTASMTDGRLVRLEGDELGADRLDHGYATTVHRSQGATVDTAHRYHDGGGRELAYVALSRARQHTTVHAVADDLDQAVEDLQTDLGSERRVRWALDQGAPTGCHPEPHRDSLVEAALRRAQLCLQRDALTPAATNRLAPPLAGLVRTTTHIQAGDDPSRAPGAGEAARRLRAINRELPRLDRTLASQPDPAHTRPEAHGLEL